MLAWSVFESPDDSGGVDGPMSGTLFGVADALAAGGVQLVEGRGLTGADGGEGLERDADQAELQKPRPTGPAGGGGGNPRSRGLRGVIGRGGMHGSISRVGTRTWGLPRPRGNPSGGTVSQERGHTSRQFGGERETPWAAGKSPETHFFKP